MILKKSREVLSCIIGMGNVSLAALRHHFCLKCFSVISGIVVCAVCLYTVLEN